MVGAGRDLLEVVRAVLRTAGLDAGDRLVVGLSGGVDSQTLTHLLARLQERGVGPELRLVHVDHRLRPGSAADARAVERFAHGLSLPIVVVTIDVEPWRAAQRQGVEAAARAARYAALARAAAEWGSAWIAVGHNRDDQVETVLLRLARGASPDGLAGMRPISARNVALEPEEKSYKTIKLVRPLLGVRRSEINSYASDHDLIPIEDESNTDPGFRRNAIRHEVLPLLERIVPGAIDSFACSAELLADDVDFLQRLALAAYEKSARQSGETLRLDREAFRGPPPALQRRILVLALRAAADQIELSRERIEALRTAVMSGAVSRRIEIGAGVAALIDYHDVLIGPFAALEAELRRTYDLPELAPGTTVAIERSTRVAAGRRWQIEIDLPCPVSGWTLRTRMPGDRLLLPNGRHTRLQDWLVNQKVPAGVRDRLPLLVHQGEVRWVAGVSANRFEDVHSRLTARLLERTKDSGPDDEYAAGDRPAYRPEKHPN